MIIRPIRLCGRGMSPVPQAFKAVRDFTGIIGNDFVGVDFINGVVLFSKIMVKPNQFLPFNHRQSRVQRIEFRNLNVLRIVVTAGIVTCNSLLNVIVFRCRAGRNAGASGQSRDARKSIFWQTRSGTRLFYWCSLRGSSQHAIIPSATPPKSPRLMTFGRAPQ